MKAQIVRAAEKMRGLDDRKCRKVGGYIKNRADGLVRYMRELVANLEDLYPRYGKTEVLLAAQLWRLFRELKNHRRPWNRDDNERQFVRVHQELRERGGEEADTIIAHCGLLIQQRHRASSAIEGFNASLRPFLYVHKGVTPGFLELFRAYYNLRTRRWGRHKGTSAHEVLTGEHVGDWLAMLGYPPSSAVN